MDPTGSTSARYASLARLLLRYGRSDLVRGGFREDVTRLVSEAVADGPELQAGSVLVEPAGSPLGTASGRRPRCR